MIRTIQDFQERWQEESENTLKVFRNLTNASLQQSISRGRSLGRLANHIIETLSELPHEMGLPVKVSPANYKNVEDIINAYQHASDDVAIVVSNNLTDEDLQQETTMYGDTWKKGFSLWVLLLHQTHHRAQMTVLMREAGLKVPGVYGPSKEEWELMKMQPME